MSCDVHYSTPTTTAFARLTPAFFPLYLVVRRRSSSKRSQFEIEIIVQSLKKSKIKVKKELNNPGIKMRKITVINKRANIFFGFFSMLVLMGFC